MNSGHISGIGGWLILPMIGLVITPLRLGFMLITMHLQIFLSGSWGILTTAGSDAYHPLWAPLILFEIFANTVLMSWSVALLVLLFAKSHHFPKWIILLYLTSLGVIALDMALSQSIPAVAEQNDPSAATELFRSIVAAIIWIPYFIKSERVRNTFVKPSAQRLQPAPMDAGGEFNVQVDAAER